MAKSERRPTEGFDFSTIADGATEARDLRGARSPIPSIQARKDAEVRLAAISETINAEIHGGNIPEILHPVPAAEAAAMLAIWPDQPQRRGLIRLAREASAWRLYLARLSLEEREAGATEEAERIAAWKQAAAPDASQISKAVATIERAAEAEAFLAGVAEQIVEAMAAHDAAQTARRLLRDIATAASISRRELTAAGHDIPETADFPAFDDAPEDALRVVKSLRPLRTVALSPLAMSRPLSRRERR